jgi:hypothetical protein
VNDLAQTTVEVVFARAATHLALIERNQRLIDATDADRECEHGKLPGDRMQTCDCWTRGEAA